MTQWFYNQSTIKNIFNQWLNTTSNVTFNNITLTGNITTTLGSVESADIFHGRNGLTIRRAGTNYITTDSFAMYFGKQAIGNGIDNCGC